MSSGNPDTDPVQKPETDITEPAAMPAAPIEPQPVPTPATTVDTATGTGGTPETGTAGATHAPTQEPTPPQPPAGSSPAPPPPAAAPAPPAATSPPTTPAPTAEQTTTAPAPVESVTPGSSPTEVSDAPAKESEPQKTERPKVKLSPVLNPSHLRAVGSADAVEQPGIVPSGQGTPAPLPPTPSGPVEIPDMDDLDADIEAQVNAALASPPPQPKVVAAPEGEEATQQPALDDSGLPIEGARLSGTVQSIHEDSVFLDVGMRISAVVPLRQFSNDKKPSVGDTVQVTVEGTDDDESLILTNLPSGTRRIAGNWDDVTDGQVVECMVTKTNKGGLEITVSNLRGFLPASQIDLAYVEDTSVYVGQKLKVKITEVNRKKKNLVVSRRALMQAERDAEAAGFWQTISEGSTYTGTVKTIKDYGAFINIGPVDGFLHIGEISWQRVNHPKDVLGVGQQVEVKVLKLDHEKKRIGLGMRQLSQNPWLLASEKYAADRTVSGKVSRIADFGAFVELEPGVEGLVHISELAWKRVRTVADVLSVGQTEEFKVLEVDANRKRISLSLKQLQAKPEPPKDQRQDSGEQATSAPTKRREPNKNLRGGTGSSASGGLFGNPSDFS